MSRRATLAALAAAALAPVAAARAQGGGFPDRPLRLVIPFPPGGGNDLIGRLLADRLGAVLGQAVAVDNRGGAGGLIGTEAAVRATPDGYTLLLGSISTISINPNLQERMAFDTIRDLAPVSLFAVTPSVLVVPAELPARSVAELVDLAKRQPGKLNFASAGPGTSHHLGGELLKQTTGIDIAHVPYRGSGPALTGLLAGETQMMIAPIAAVLAMIEAGRLRALGVTSAARSPLLPQVPAIGETIPGYDFSLWYGLFAPARTPAPVIARLNAAVATAVAQPEVAQRLSGEGATAQASTPQALGAIAQEDLLRWRRIIAGMPPI